MSLIGQSEPHIGQKMHTVMRATTEELTFGVINNKSMFSTVEFNTAEILL